MSKLKFKEERRFRFWEFYAILGIIILGALYRVFEQFAFEATISWSAVALYSSIVAIAVGVVFILTRVKMLTIVSKKGIKYQLYPFHIKRKKIKWEDIEEYRLVELPGQARWSGWNMHFNADRRSFGFGENSGLYLKMKDGQNLFIGIESESDLKESMDKFARVAE